MLKWYGTHQKYQQSFYYHPIKCHTLGKTGTQEKNWQTSMNGLEDPSQRLKH